MARNFSTAAEIQLSSAAQVLNLSAFAFICWFRTSASSGYREIYTGESNFNEQWYFRVNTGNTVEFWYRTPTAFLTITSAGTYNDGAWHWALVLRRGSADFQVYIDGSSIGTSTNNPGTITVTPSVALGNWNSGTGIGDENFNGDLARCILIPQAVEVEEASGIAYSGRCRFPVRFWHELDIPGSSVPDWSSNQYTGTVTNTTLADHPPIALGWFGAAKELAAPPASGITGTGAATLAGLTVSGAGSVAITGTSAKTLGNVTSSAAGTLPITGAGAATLDDLSASGAGVVTLIGTGAATLDDLAVSSAGLLPITGTAANTLDALTVTGAGTVTLSGTGSATLDTLTSSSVGTLTITGTGAGTLDDLTATGSDSGTIEGTGAATLEEVTASGAGSVAITGAGSITLDDVTSAAAGVITITGTSAVTLSALTSSSAGTLSITGSAAITLGTLTLSAADQALAVGVMNGTISAAQPAMTFTSTQPDMAYTSAQPAMTFSEDA